LCGKAPSFLRMASVAGTRRISTQRRKGAKEFQPKIYTCAPKGIRVLSNGTQLKETYAREPKPNSATGDRR
jgi:hypothetical protein